MMLQLPLTSTAFTAAIVLFPLQHAKMMELTDAVREPPYLRHFNLHTAGGGSSGSGASAGLQAKVSLMKRWGAWSLDADTESELLCRAVATSTSLGGAVGAPATSTSVRDGGGRSVGDPSIGGDAAPDGDR